MHSAHHINRSENYYFYIKCKDNYETNDKIITIQIHILNTWYSNSHFKTMLLLLNRRIRFTIYIFCWLSGVFRNGNFADGFSSKQNQHTDTESFGLKHCIVNNISNYLLKVFFMDILHTHTSYHTRKMVYSLFDCRWTMDGKLMHQFTSFKVHNGWSAM